MTQLDWLTERDRRRELAQQRLARDVEMRRTSHETRRFVEHRAAALKATRRATA